MMQEKLNSEKIVVAAPLSFAGSAARIHKISDSSDNVWVKWTLLLPVSTLLICFAWSGILIWYLIFGLLLVPYRIIRRGHRAQIGQIIPTSSYFNEQKVNKDLNKTALK